jgi:UrcA family protein
MKLCTVIFSLCWAFAAVAAPQSGRHTAESLRTTVAVNDLNLATAAGYTEALQRISSAARRLCNQFRNTSRVDDRESAAACVQAAMADASSQLQQVPKLNLSASMAPAPTPVAKVARVMADNRIGSAIVTKHDKRVGIFTVTDACRAPVEALGDHDEEANGVA